jgi:proteasome accessory factor B
MATDRTERLLNLVICLLGAQRPVSRAALREGIPGYGESASDDAFERMFERDKDELRQMGIPVDTVVNAQGEVEGYLIDHEAYAMPAVALTPSELAVLGLAGRVWTEAALTVHAGAALRKIEATTGDRWDPPMLVAGRPGTGEEALPALWEAIRSRSVVSFDYLARGRDSSEARTVEPWATVHRDGAWYLVGLSRERAAGRVFRLSRISGPIRLLSEISEPPSRAEVEALVAGIADPPARGTAQARLPDRGAARLRESARDRGDGTWDVDYVDEQTLVAEVIEAGGVLLAPESAVACQRESLLRVAQLHA